MLKHNLFLNDNSASQSEYKRQLTSTIDAIVEAFDNDKAYTGKEPYDLKKLIQIDEILPEAGLGFDKVLDKVKALVLPNMLRPSSGDYMAHLHSPALLECVASEIIISTFNQSMDSWDQSPVATEIEVETIKYLCKMYGYAANSDGLFTSGGSQSNMSGIILARDWYCSKKLNHDIRRDGLPTNFNKLRMYTSEISHFSMEKSAHVLGLGYNSVVKVPVNRAQQMDIDALRELVKSDVAAGNMPFCIVATQGTTDYGSIDNIKAIRELCDEYGIWLHADAAYGSGVIMSKKYSSRIAGLDTCDSITVDFHKMFLMPISCGAFLLKDEANFEYFQFNADYLNRKEDEEDGYTNLVGKSLQTTRRFDALKVWMSFQVRGAAEWSEVIDTCIENAATLYSKVKNNPLFDVVTEPEITSVVFRVNHEDDAKADEINKRIRRALIHDKGIVIGQTVFDNKVFLKCTLLNPTLDEKSLDGLLETITSLI